MTTGSALAAAVDNTYGWKTEDKQILSGDGGDLKRRKTFFFSKYHFVVLVHVCFNVKKDKQKKTKAKQNKIEIGFCFHITVTHTQNVIKKCDLLQQYII